MTTEGRSDFTYVSICVDCLFRNEHSTEINDTHEFAFQKAVKEYGGFPSVVTTDDGELRQSFGKSPCDFCQTPLHGDRFLATVLY